MLFDPDQWKGKGQELKLDKYRLSDSEMIRLGVISSELRRNLAAKVSECTEGTKSPSEVEFESLYKQKVRL